jgi:hypothetical protein
MKSPTSRILALPALATSSSVYARKGQALDPKQDGTLRLVIVSAKNN